MSSTLTEGVAENIVETIRAWGLPYVAAGVGNIGGLYVQGTVSLDSKGAWSNGILENSRYLKFIINEDASGFEFRVASGYRIPKIRAARKLDKAGLYRKLAAVQKALQAEV